MEMSREFTDTWRAHRMHLVDLAFRILGDIGAAEDAVQEAFTRLSPARDVEDERAWLTVVTGRLCLDQLRSAWHRHEKPSAPADLVDADPLLPMPVPDPADRVTLDDEVQLALLVLLQRLSPPERVAFILHDVFGQPFELIADTLGRPAGTCRQLARRARGKISDADRLPKAVAAEQHRAVTERFIAACTGGDLDALVAVLHPDAWGRASFAAALGLEPVLSHGPHEVATNLLPFYGPDVTMVTHPHDDRPAVLAYRDRRLFAVLVLTIADDRILRIEATVDPA
ncbi:RNA polymerase sigma factor SigI [Nocardia sp. alder85J]|uniref:RNA polymerase sigma factor SigI n=1 Tax=Nocardia sp. alder85J TaxID=2862949 RepID=UPI001CD68A59|nr:RNA polymerase sigma factor SigI [Nocardia sp. alder85J]MCX4098881.1 RNA polymerase sigma factor SigI [Nocardia sp. alder85J]